VARQQAELATRQRADEEARRAAAEQARVAAAPAGTGAQPAGGAGAGSGNGGAGRQPGSIDLAGRARELVRGLNVLDRVPPALRPAEQEQHARRRLVAGAAERSVPLRMYIDSFRQKIERNGALNGGQLPADRVRIDPVVSVALRSDGSVEDVLIVRSSGHAALDQAVRRIVRLNERYAAFPPNVAEHYDVIEIRRIWSFADGLKLLEEMR
jgi:TonB family protein